MSFRTPSLTLTWACAAPAARPVSTVASRSVSNFIASSNELLGGARHPALWSRPDRREGESALDAQITVQLAHVGFEVRVGERIDHVPLLHDIVAVGGRAGGGGAAFPQGGCLNPPLGGGGGAAALLHHDGGPPPGRLLPEVAPRA